MFGFSLHSFAEEEIKTQKYTEHNKGKFFVSWGGNRESYSKSDVTFKGKDYNFTVDNMTAHDKPKGWHVDYINPMRITFSLIDCSNLSYTISATSSDMDISFQSSYAIIP